MQQLQDFQFRGTRKLNPSAATSAITSAAPAPATSAAAAPSVAASSAAAPPASSPAAAASSAGGTASDAIPAGVAGKGYVIGASVWTHVPWLDSYGNALVALGKQYGVKVNVLYSNANAQTQTSQVQTLIAQHPNAIIFTGVDPSADNAVLAQIKAAGIITIGGIIQPTDPGMALLAAYRGPNDLTHGKLAADALAQALKGKTGEVAIVRGDPGGTDNTNRASAFKAELAKVAPGLKIVADQNSSFGDEKAPYDVTTAILAAHPNIIGIMGEADSIANAAVKAVADAHKTGQIQIVGIGGSCEGFTTSRQERCTARHCKTHQQERWTCSAPHSN